MSSRDSRIRYGYDRQRHRDDVQLTYLFASDLKATALLKLIYLEMFGHDMSWASFNVLEVMSSPKYLQKRVGYLAAVQSFRPDTEVLMLATNLLKKVIAYSIVVRQRVYNMCRTLLLRLYRRLAYPLSPCHMSSPPRYLCPF